MLKQGDITESLSHNQGSNRLLCLPLSSSLVAETGSFSVNFASKCFSTNDSQNTDIVI